MPGAARGPSLQAISTLGLRGVTSSQRRASARSQFAGTLPSLLLPEQAGCIVGYGKKTMLRLARKGLVPCVRLSAQAIRFDAAELVRWLDARRSTVNRARRGRRMRNA